MTPVFWQPDKIERYVLLTLIKCQWNISNCRVVDEHLYHVTHLTIWYVGAESNLD
jgi:hypothetical protein